MTKIAVVGSLIIDLAVITQRLPAARETLLSQQYKLGPGGKGANSAVAAHRAGAESLLIGCIGNDDLGRVELAALRQEGLNLEGVVVHPTAPSGIAIALIEPSGENTILVVVGANDELGAADVTRALARGGKLDAILINFEVPESAVAAAVQAGRKQGIPVLVDAGPARPYPPAVWGDCTILTPNELEAALLVGYPIPDIAAARQAAGDLLAMGPQAVVLHLGERGALIVTRDSATEIPGFPVQVVDTTGAGDAFSGTLVVAVAQGLPLEQAVRRANAAGALAVTRLGTLPIMPTRQEVEAFLMQRRAEQ